MASAIRRGVSIAALVRLVLLLANHVVAAGEPAGGRYLFRGRRSIASPGRLGGGRVRRTHLYLRPQFFPDYPDRTVGAHLGARSNSFYTRSTPGELVAPRFNRLRGDNRRAHDAHGQHVHDPSTHAVGRTRVRTGTAQK